MSSASRTALVAPDSFKGTLIAAEVAAALAAGFEREGWEVDACPLADGGEGTAAALLSARGGRTVTAPAHDPLGRRIDAEIALVDGLGAVVEVAAASGLVLLEEDERDPERTTTAGTGELIVAAARLADRILVGIGGSATNDGGAGAIEAIRAGGGIAEVRIVCLCDAITPWERASATFGPQKGADTDAVARLEQRLDDLAGELPRDPRGVPMSGAAGGLAGGLWAWFDAELAGGAAYVCELVELDRRIARADVVVTGEGRLDATTREGKVAAEVARRAAAAATPVHAVVGTDSSDAELRAELGLATVRSATDPGELAAAAAELAAEIADPTLR